MKNIINPTCSSIKPVHFASLFALNGAKSCIQSRRGGTRYNGWKAKSVITTYLYGLYTPGMFLQGKHLRHRSLAIAHRPVGAHRSQFFRDVLRVGIFLIGPHSLLRLVPYHHLNSLLLGGPDVQS